MKRLKRFLRIFLLTVVALAVVGWVTFVIVVNTTMFHTRLSPGHTVTIVRHPGAAKWGKGVLSEIPSYDRNSPANWQVDLRSCDVSRLSLAGKENDLLYADFDSKTRWPQDIGRLSRFKPDKFMDLGKNPGLGVRSLHARGITGKGVGIAIMDQTLLVDHVEYKDRLKMYEEIHNWGGSASMHAPATASIAVGKTVGVAPGADLYQIAEWHGRMGLLSRFVWDFRSLAQSIDRIVEVNKRLPKERKIRVISVSVGWSPDQKGRSAQGYREVVAAVERAKKAGIFVVSCSLTQTYRWKPAFHGLGRDPLADPDNPESYRPGLWWAGQFFRQKSARDWPPDHLLLIPMDSRCTAAPNGTQDYAFYRSGGWSWCVPYIAGLYALACQVKPDVTPEVFWKAAMETGDTTTIREAGKQYRFGKIVNPGKLIARLQGTRLREQ